MCEYFTETAALSWKESVRRTRPVELRYASFSVSPLINRLITFQSNLVPSLQDLKKTRLCEEYSCWTASKMVHWCCTMDATVSRSPNNKERQKRCILNSFSFSSKPQKATERPLSLHLHCPSCVRLDDEMQVHLHILGAREITAPWWFLWTGKWWWARRCILRAPFTNIIDGINFCILMIT